MKKQKKILIVVGHPDKKSFCWNGIYKTATRQMRKHKQSYRVIDLYRDSFQRPSTDLIKKYQDLQRGPHISILFHLCGGSD